jgi:hypothetical protein
MKITNISVNATGKFFMFALCFFLLFSCTSHSALEQSLHLAGANRPELEKVLQRYKANPADSLKYRAACFLIENMPYHYSIIKRV